MVERRWPLHAAIGLLIPQCLHSSRLTDTVLVLQEGAGERRWIASWIRVAEFPQWPTIHHSLAVRSILKTLLIRHKPSSPMPVFVVALSRESCDLSIEACDTVSMRRHEDFTRTVQRLLVAPKQVQGQPWPAHRSHCGTWSSCYMSTRARCSNAEHRME